MLSFFPRGVLDEILNLIESVSEDFIPILQENAKERRYSSNYLFRYRNNTAVETATICVVG